MSVTLTADQLRAIAGKRAKTAIIEQVAEQLPVLGKPFGLNEPHRLAHFVAQLAHESAGFSTTKEFASGAAYEGRKDLGNIQKGDGVRFKGHGLIQVTGRANHREFTEWVQARIRDAPDFEKEPDKLMEFPWALLSALWFWSTRKLNALADANNIEMITKRINGGRNGLADRIEIYERTALTMLGFGLDETGVKAFQKRAELEVDGLTGPKTRAALHAALKALGAVDRAGEEIDQPIPESVKPKPQETLPQKGPTPVQSQKGRLTKLTVALIMVVIAVAVVVIVF